MLQRPLRGRAGPGARWQLTAHDHGLLGADCGACGQRRQRAALELARSGPRAPPRAAPGLALATAERWAVREARACMVLCWREIGPRCVSLGMLEVRRWWIGRDAGQKGLL